MRLIQPAFGQWVERATTLGLPNMPMFMDRCMDTRLPMVSAVSE